MSGDDPLGVDFFARDVQIVARDLIGRWLRPEHRDAPWRYAARGTRGVSHPRSLR